MELTMIVQNMPAIVVMYYYTKLSFLEQLDMNVSITIKPFYGTDP
jgi:hypothetical protein